MAIWNMKRRALYQLQPGNPVSQFEDIDVIPDQTPAQIANRRKFRAVRPTRPSPITTEGIRDFQMTAPLLSVQAQRALMSENVKPPLFGNEEVKVNSPSKPRAMFAQSTELGFRHFIRSESTTAFLASATQPDAPDTPKLAIRVEGTPNVPEKSLITVSCGFGASGRDFGPGNLELVLVWKNNLWTCLLVFRNTVGRVLFIGQVPSVSIWKFPTDLILSTSNLGKFEVATLVYQQVNGAVISVNWRLSLTPEEWERMRSTVAKS